MEHELEIHKKVATAIKIFIQENDEHLEHMGQLKENLCDHLEIHKKTGRFKKNPTVLLESAKNQLAKYLKKQERLQEAEERARQAAIDEGKGLQPDDLSELADTILKKLEGRLVEAVANAVFSKIEQFLMPPKEKPADKVKDFKDLTREYEAMIKSLQDDNKN